VTEQQRPASSAAQAEMDGLPAARCGPTIECEGFELPTQLVVVSVPADYSPPIRYPAI
jgi:hypothetical protein